MLSDVEKKFVEAFNGDVRAAAKKCGLTVREGDVILRKVEVRDAIRQREKAENPAHKDDVIATRADRQQFWSRLMDGIITNARGVEELVALELRVKASELLGKSECDFSERRVHEGSATGPMQTALTIAIDVTDRLAQLMRRGGAPPPAIDVTPPRELNFLE